VGELEALHNGIRRIVAEGEAGLSFDFCAANRLGGDDDRMVCRAGAVDGDRLVVCVHTIRQDNLITRRRGSYGLSQCVKRIDAYDSHGLCVNANAGWLGCRKRIRGRAQREEQKNG
jgi:hypothetical protein